MAKESAMTNDTHVDAVHREEISVLWLFSDFWPSVKLCRVHGIPKMGVVRWTAIMFTSQLFCPRFLRTKERGSTRSTYITLSLYNYIVGTYSALPRILSCDKNLGMDKIDILDLDMTRDTLSVFHPIYWCISYFWCFLSGRKFDLFKVRSMMIMLACANIKHNFWNFICNCWWFRVWQLLLLFFILQYT